MKAGYSWIGALQQLITPQSAALFVGLWDANLVSTNADDGNSKKLN